MGRQFCEAAFLRIVPPYLGLSDYHRLRVFDPTFTASERRQFAGYRAEGQIDRAFNEMTSRMMVTDKVIFNTILASVTNRIPRRFLLYAETGSYSAFADCVTSADEARERIHEINCSFFAKPIRGASGRDAFAVERFDKTNDVLEMPHGYRHPFRKLKDIASDTRNQGVLIEERLRPHPRFGTDTSGVSTIRIIVVRRAGNASVPFATLRIPAGRNLTDTFSRGANGNLAAAIDVTNGRIIRCVRFQGVDTQVITHHPDREQQITGCQIPEFDEIIGDVKAGSSLFPDLGLQHWDVALTDNGPRILEMNVQGDFDMHQMAYGRGILCGELDWL